MSAADRLHVDARPTTVSTSKRVRAFVGNLFLAVITGPSTWPPVDVVLVDESTGRALKTWHEGGAGASLLIEVLNEDLAKMTLDEFVEKWDVPPL